VNKPIFQLVKSSCEIVSAKRALKLLEFNTFYGQRRIEMPRAIRYGELMGCGRFGIAEIAFAVFQNGDRRLVNGQHTLTGSSISGNSFNAVVSEYAVASEDDFVALYCLFDANRTRSIRDMASVEAERPENNGIQKKVIAWCMSACWLLRDDPTVPHLMNRKIVDKQVAVELSRASNAELRFVSSVVECHDVVTVPVITAMVATFRACGERTGRAFWSNVIMGDELVKGSPQFNLRRDLLRNKGKRFCGGGAAYLSIYNICIAWFNSWLRKTPRSSVKASTMTEPLRIAAKEEGK